MIAGVPPFAASGCGCDNLKAPVITPVLGVIRSVTPRPFELIAKALWAGLTLKSTKLGTGSAFATFASTQLIRLFAVFAATLVMFSTMFGETGGT